MMEIHDTPSAGLESCFWNQPPMVDWSDAHTVVADAGGQSSDQSSTRRRSCVAFLHDVDWMDIPVRMISTLDQFFGSMDVPVFYKSAVPMRNHDEPSDRSKEILNRGDRFLSLHGERFGVTAADFQNSDGLDFRLMRHVRQDGSLGYDGNGDASGEINFSISLPAEVSSMTALVHLVQRWRRLFPSTTRFVATIDASSLVHHLVSLVPCGFDALIIVADQPALHGLPLAAAVRRVRGQLDAANLMRTQLWIVPPPMPIDELAKLWSLGADGIAMDHHLKIDPGSFHNPLGGWGIEFASAVDLLRGLVRFAHERPTGHPALVSTDPQVANILGLPYFGVGMNSSMSSATKLQ